MRPIGGYSTTSLFHRRNRFPLPGFLGDDERIFEAHARAVRVALKEFEDFAATRVRIGGARNERLTGNFAAALFTHDTSRALDPHLHTHCIVFNATFDPVENRWKALENYELLRAQEICRKRLLPRSCP